MTSSLEISSFEFPFCAMRIPSALWFDSTPFLELVQSTPNFRLVPNEDGLKKSDSFARAFYSQLRITNVFD